MNTVSGADYTPHRKLAGGSKKGQRKIRWTPIERVLIWLFGMKFVARGNEEVFLRSTISRWSEEAFFVDVCVHMLFELSPTLMERVLDVDGFDTLPNRVLNRHHKMYYDFKKGGKRRRAYSKEHPLNNKKYRAAIPKATEMFNTWIETTNLGAWK